MDVRRLPDFVLLGDHAVFGCVALVGGAALAPVAHGDPLVVFGTMVPMGVPIGSRREGPNPAGHADEQRSERREAAENEDEPAFHQPPDDQIVYNIWRTMTSAPSATGRKG